MGKTLRLTFAMGGGVSLASFSGAALTEALKCLVLFGVDENGNPYEDVVLDSMSGASAGAIALAILMRSLMDFQSIASIIARHYVLEKVGKGNKRFYHLMEMASPSKKEDTILKEEFLQELGKKVKMECSIDDNDPRMDTLMAIEVAQLLQEILWVREVNIQMLLRDNSNGSNVENFSLLPRGVFGRAN